MATVDPIDYLANLNAAQTTAVTHPPDTPLQILAGPGSGKTRVLTCRVAHLVRHHGIPPSQICAVTFTNKAANEMRERLKKLIGPEDTARLVMGTFHALCAKYLRRHGQRITLPNNFSIADAEAARRIIANILREKAVRMKEAKFTLKDTEAQSRISSMKAKGMTPQLLLGQALQEEDEWKKLFAEIYEDYRQELLRHNCLDFDDLLVFGVELFRAAPDILNNIRHILVDEFQDTNTKQYELMQRFAHASGSVSTVGDPDQSIYGWRAAEIENLNRMRKDFPRTMQVLLEENYRSTGSILDCSLAIVSQDKSRIDKGLFTSHPKGSTPVNRSFPNDLAESGFIATEIKRVIAYTGGALGYNDFVILLRYNALSRVLESALQRAGIPNRVLAGQKFFDRLEIKDLLAYLQLVDNPRYGPAFTRVINVPRRAIGDKTLEQIMEMAKKKDLSPMEIVELIAAGKIPDTKPNVRKKVGPFLKQIRRLRQLAAEGTSAPDMIEQLLTIIHYEDWLRKTQQDWELRWENVRELINFASQIAHEHAGVEGLPDFPDETPPPVPVISSSNQEDKEVDSPPYYLTAHEAQALKESEIVLTESELAAMENCVDITDVSMRDVMKATPLRHFLEVSMLSTDEETQESETKERVTISTCHSAKGLEWPVVFIPACEQGIFPFYRSDDTEEERRLLYVACTRAQALLYVSHTQIRMSGGETKPVSKSDFLTDAMRGNRNILTPRTPSFSHDEVAVICKVTERMVPSAERINASVSKYVSVTGPGSGGPTPTSSQEMYPSSTAVIPPGTQGFQTASAIHAGTVGSGTGASASQPASKPFKTPSLSVPPPVAPLQRRPPNQAAPSDPPSKTELQPHGASSIGFNSAHAIYQHPGQPPVVQHQSRYVDARQLMFTTESYKPHAPVNSFQEVSPPFPPTVLPPGLPISPVPPPYNSLPNLPPSYHAPTGYTGMPQGPADEPIKLATGQKRLGMGAPRKGGAKKPKT